MFSKKSLPITIAFILILALGTIGLAYGAWSDQLVINGDVTTGTLDIDFTAAWPDTDSGDPLSCVMSPLTIDENTNTITFTINNAYPGYQCIMTAAVKNVGTLPVRVTPVLAADAEIDQYLTVTAAYASPFNLALGQEAWIDIDFSIPVGETGNQGLENKLFSYTLTANQLP